MAQRKVIIRSEPCVALRILYLVYTSSIMGKELRITMVKSKVGWSGKVL